MIILASQSPRRKELLGLMGLEFQAITADVDERMDPALPIREEIARVGLSKAQAVRSKCAAADVIIAADTMVCIDGRRLGKPKDAEDAVRMLQMLSGTCHEVITGLAVVQAERAETATVTTVLHFRPLSEQEIRAYVATGEPMDKAGAYGIQGMAAMFADRIDGDYYNVMGLPVCALTSILRRFGVKILGC